MNVTHGMILQKTSPRLLATLVLLSVGQVASATNPYLAPTAFIPDGEPRVFTHEGEPRVYVYGSRDERVHDYCGYGHDVWSAPVDDLTQWTDHGEIFHVKQVQEIGFGKVSEQHFGAPDCVYNPVTKTYHLYTFLGAVYRMDGVQGPRPGSANHVPGFEDKGPKCVMATSDSPAGPFMNPVMCDWPPANEAGAFDPAVLVDEQPDGSVRVYVYWGMMRGDRWAEVDPADMHTIIDPVTRKPDRNAWRNTLEGMRGTSLFEASSIRRIAKDRYVFVYSPNERMSALSYCYSNSPEGPWTFGGRIVDNSVAWHGGNNHGSIAQIEGTWYVFYHRATCNDFNRQAMIEPIGLEIEGDKVSIPQVEMTSQGVEANGLAAYRRYNAGILCYRSGNLFIDGKQRRADGVNPVVNIGNDNVMGYKYLNFGDRPVTDADRLNLELNIRVLQDCKIRVLVARPSEANDSGKRVEIATSDLRQDGKEGEFRPIRIPVIGLEQNVKLNELRGLKGKLALFLRFEGPGGELCQMKEIEFAKDGDAGLDSAIHNGLGPAQAGAMDTAGLRNPVWTSGDNLRDPSVLKVEGGYQVFYSRRAGHWGNPSSWTIANAFTRDFRQFENIRDVSTKGHASPGDVVQWHGRWILPYQTYPANPSYLVFAESADLETWSDPKPFLKEAMGLPCYVERFVMWCVVDSP